MRALKIALLAAALMPAAAYAQPIQGLYVSGGGGLAWLENQRLLSTTQGGTTTVYRPAPANNFRAGFNGFASLGWAFGNGVRTEIEGLYQDNKQDSRNAAGISGREKKLGAMANVLFDLDIGSPYVYPYLGAGIGYVSLNRTLKSSGLTLDDSHGVVAEQAIGGTSFPVPGVVGLSVTADYRFLVLNGSQSFHNAQGNGFRVRDDHNHMITVGLRYAFNVAPPPMPAAPAPAPVVAAAPAPAPARSYLVFFDWDKADLTARAQQIIAEAARNATKVGSTRIDVAGHADKSGTAAYNQTLSLARANNVAAELVRLGVAKTAISITAFGDTKPLVPTADGVREPQNRRVEIVLR